MNWFTMLYLSFAWKFSLDFFVSFRFNLLLSSFVIPSLYLNSHTRPSISSKGFFFLLFLAQYSRIFLRISFLFSFLLSECFTSNIFQHNIINVMRSNDEFFPVLLLAAVCGVSIKYLLEVKIHWLLYISVGFLCVCVCFV